MKGDPWVNLQFLWLLGLHSQSSRERSMGAPKLVILCIIILSTHTHTLQEGILLAVAVLVQDPLTSFAGSAAAGKVCKLLQLQIPHLQD